jgi:hypothetical protein
MEVVLMEFTQADRTMLQETHDSVTKIQTLLVGEDGGGLCKRVESHSKRIRCIELVLACAAGAGGLFGLASKVIGG